MCKEKDQKPFHNIDIGFVSRVTIISIFLPVMTIVYIYRENIENIVSRAVIQLVK